MLIDRHVPEDVFARVPEVAAQTDPHLRSDRTAIAYRKQLKELGLTFETA